MPRAGDTTLSSWRVDVWSGGGAERLLQLFEYAGGAARHLDRWCDLRHDPRGHLLVSVRHLARSREGDRFAAGGDGRVEGIEPIRGTPVSAARRDRTTRILGRRDGRRWTCVDSLDRFGNRVTFTGPRVRRSEGSNPSLSASQASQLALANSAAGLQRDRGAVSLLG